MSKDAFLTDLADAVGEEPSDLSHDYELHWDSLLVVSTMSLINEHFDCTVEVDALVACETIGAVLQLIDQQRTDLQAA